MKMKRSLSFLTGTGILSCAPFLQASQHPVQKPSERPNILWLIVDDINPDLGCYGNKFVKTPNLDRLAEQGIRYTRAYAAATVCSPSRSALFTGCYASTVNCHQHRSYIGHLPEGYHSLPGLLRKNGYFTVNLIAHGGNRQKLIDGSSGKTDFNWDDRHDLDMDVHTFDCYKPETIFTGTTWEKRKPAQPFFAYANIETPKAYGFGPGTKWAEAKGIAVDPNTLPIPPYLADTPAIRREIASYYNAVSHTDAVIGKFLSALEKAGYADNTLVIFTADHGRATMRHKQTLYNTGLLVPLIIRWPGHVKPGRVSDDLVSLIDLVPTTLNAAHISIPRNIEGLDLFSPAIKHRKYIFATRDRTDEAFDRSRAVISKRYKYIRHFHPEIPYINGRYAKRRLCYPDMVRLFKEGKLTPAQAAFLASRKPKEELYDMANDPFEIHNLADNPKYAEVLEDMRKVLQQWIKDSHDYGALSREQQPVRRGQAKKLASQKKH